MNDIKKYFIRFVDISSAIALLVILVSCLMQVVARFIFDTSFYWTDELAVYLMIWMVFLGSVKAVVNNQHSNIDSFVAKLHGNAGKAAEIIVNISCIVFCTAIAYYAIPVVKLGMTKMSQGFKIPMGFVYLALPVSFIFMIFFFILNIISIVKPHIDDDERLEKDEVIEI